MNYQGQSNAHVIRAGKRPYIAMGIVILGPQIFLCSLVLAKDFSTIGVPGISFIKLLLAVSFLYGFMVFWFKSYKIEITDKSISFSNIESLWKKSTLLFAEIGQANVTSRSFARTESGKMKPFTRLELIPRKDIKKPAMMINILVFAPDDMQRIYQTLEAKGVEVKGGKDKKGK